MFFPRPANRLFLSCLIASGFVTNALAADESPRVGLSASLFAIDAKGPVNNVSLQWDSADAGNTFAIERAAKESGPFERIYAGTGKSFKDYALADGTYFYRLGATSKNKEGTPTFSNIASVTTMPMPANLKTYSNEVPNDVGLGRGGVKVGDTYYGFNFVRQDKALKHLMMRTSIDGKNWKDAGPVMDASSHPDLADCKFEAENYFYDPTHDKIILWGHFEKQQGYASGKAIVASAKPGEKFTVHHIYNPLGVEVRDMSIYIDDDKQGYLVAASNVKGQGANATLYIFKLNATYDDATEVVAKVVENGYREAPHILKKDGFYYLFFSQAAGWFPSMGGYVSSRSIAGPWNGPRSIGNPSTFSSQSGGILKFGEADPHQPIMMGNRWVRGEGTNRNSSLPVQLANGFAFYDYHTTLLHDAARNILIPLDNGRLLSQDSKATASIPGKADHEIAKAFDGDYFTSFQSDTKKWPFDIVTDLGKPSTLKNIQISWFLHKGSEAFYTYTIEGSLDGKEWKTLLDHTNAADPVLSKTYGFTSDDLPASSVARYVRLSVKNVKLHNNPNNWYPPTVWEVKVFGDQIEK